VCSMVRRKPANPFSGKILCMTSEPPDWPIERWDQVPETVRVHLVYYKKLQSYNQFWSRGLELATLVVSAAIPVTAALKTNIVVPGALGALVVILTGINTRARYRENYLRETQIILAIQYQLVLFNYGEKPYDGNENERKAVLALRVEDLIERDARIWVGQEREHSQNKQSGMNDDSPNVSIPCFIEPLPFVVR
jgi:Protein of unknown function (DUF4231)